MAYWRREWRFDSGDGRLIEILEDGGYMFLTVQGEEGRVRVRIDPEEELEIETAFYGARQHARKIRGEGTA